MWSKCLDLSLLKLESLMSGLRLGLELFDPVPVWFDPSLGRNHQLPHFASSGRWLEILDCIPSIPSSPVVMSDAFFDPNAPWTSPRHNEQTDRTDFITATGSKAEMYWWAVRYWFHGINALSRGEFANVSEFYGTLTTLLPYTSPMATCYRIPLSNTLPQDIEYRFEQAVFATLVVLLQYLE